MQSNRKLVQSELYEILIPLSHPLDLEKQLRFFALKLISDNPPNSRQVHHHFQIEK